MPDSAGSARSRAVLIGTGTYRFLPQVPAALNSLARFHALLTGPLCGWSAEQVSVFADPQGAGELADGLVELFEDVRDVALFYYVGHGQIDPEDTLCLGLTGSRDAAHRRRTTSLPFDAVRYALTRSRARVKIVILDCCYAGLAVPGTLASPDAVDLTRGTGAYTLAAAGEFAKAWFEFGEGVAVPQTYFTKYLVDVIEAGIPGEGPELRIEPIFNEVVEALARDGKPVPASRASGDATRFVFARNAAPHRESRSTGRAAARCLVAINGAGPRPGLRDTAALLAERLQCRLILPELLNEPTEPTWEDIRTAVGGWLDDPSRTADDTLVVYYTGPDAGPAASAALRQLPELLETGPPREVLVLADTHTTGETPEPPRPDPPRDPDRDRLRRFLIATRVAAHVAADPLALTLAEEIDDARHGRANQPYLDPDSLLQSLADRIRAAGGEASSLSPGAAVRSALFPNPRYQPLMPLGLDLRSQRSALTREETLAHWSPKSRGVQSEGDPGWHFTGRATVLEELVTWLNGGDGRMRIVTGGPGSGKSAVLGRLVTLADAEYRARVPARQLADAGAVPPVGGFDLAVHARGKTTEEIVALLAQAAGSSAGDPASLVAALMSRQSGFTVAIDAVDEAQNPKSLTRGLIAPLAAAWRSGVRVLVGTRRELLPALGSSAVVIDLDTPGYSSRADLAQYVLKTMLDSETSAYAAQPRLAELVADAVAARAFPNYLIGRIVGHTLAEEPAAVDMARRGWRRSFPSTVGDALDAYLERFGPDEQRVRDLLEPLAYAAGVGLPWENIWAAAASALSGTTYTDRDVRYVLQEAGAYILETAEEGRSVYRLFHQALADHLRRPAREADVHRKLTRVLTAAGTTFPGSGRVDWRRCSPYVQRHLCEHAARAGELDTYICDPLFLVAAVPSVLASVLPAASREHAQRTAKTYQHTVHRLRAGRYDDNAAALELVARCEGDDLLADELRSLALGQPWRPAWVRWSPSPNYRLIGQHDGAVTTIAVTRFDDEDIVVSGGQDGTVRRFPVGAQTLIDEPLSGHEGAVTSVAVGTAEGRTLIISGGQDGTVRRYDLADGIPVGEPLSGHEGPVTAIATGTAEGRTLIVSAGQDGTLRRYDLADGTPVGEPLSGHEGPITTIAIGTTRHRTLIASAGQDGTVRRYDLADGTPVGEPLIGSGKPINAVAFAYAESGRLITAGDDNWEIHCWDAETGLPHPPVVRGHDAQISALAAGDREYRYLLASGSSDTTVVVRDLRDAEGESSTSIKLLHDGRISAVAFWELDRRPVLISASADTTIRCWDLDEVLAAIPATAEATGVSALAVGTLPDRPFVAGGGADGRLHWWDVESGELLRSSATQHADWLNNMAAGGDRVLSVGGDGTLRQWDSATGREITAPMQHGSADAWINAVAGWQADPSRDTPADQPADAIAVTADDAGHIWRWDLANAQPIGEPLDGHAGSVTGLSVIDIHGEPVIVSTGADMTLRRWSLFTGRPIGQPLHGHSGRVWTVETYRERGRPMALTGDESGCVFAWDLLTGERITDWTAHGTEVLAIGVGPLAGRRRIVTGGGDGILRTWRSLGTIEHTIALGSSILQLAVSAPDHILVGTYRGIVDLRFAS